MRRIVLGGAELAGFDSPGADDHIKLFFPNAAGEMVLPVLTAEGRSYPDGKERRRVTTPRAGGITKPASWPSTSCCTTRAWPGRGERAQPGDTLVICYRAAVRGGRHLRRHVLIGDETALPAIARWLDVLPEDAEVQAFIEVRDEDDARPAATRTCASTGWSNGFPAPAVRCWKTC